MKKLKVHEWKPKTPDQLRLTTSDQRNRILTAMGKAAGKQRGTNREKASEYYGGGRH